MNVLHVIPGIAPRYGGPSQAIVDMCQALKAQGVDTLIATTDADGPDRLTVPDGQVTSYRGTPAIFFPRQWSESFKYSRPLARWLDRQVAAFDVVHIHAVFSHACLAAARAARRRGVPYIVRPYLLNNPGRLPAGPAVRHQGSPPVVAPALHGYSRQGRRSLRRQRTQLDPRIIERLPCEL